MKLAGSVGEVESFDPMALLTGGGGGGTPLRALLDELDELAAEDQLVGLVLRVGDLSMDMARAEELRAGLIAFKGDGARKLHCHAEGLSNASYYLLTACDQLVMAPLGSVMMPGPAATPVHLKGLLDKLGVEADFLHVGAFKGAAEPLTRDAPSPEMIETLDARGRPSLRDHGHRHRERPRTRPRTRPALGSTRPCSPARSRPSAG